MNQLFQTGPIESTWQSPDSMSPGNTSLETVCQNCPSIFMNFKIERFTEPFDAFQRLLPEWEALDAQLTPRTPFSSPTWCQLWWKHLRRNTLRARDDFFLHTVRKRNHQLVAVAPLMITYNPAVGPFRIRTLQFLGADSITEVRGLVCRIEDQDAVIRALMRYFSLHCSEWDLFQWRGILKLETTSISLGGIEADNFLPTYLVDVPSTWHDLAKGLSSNMRKSIRKSYEFLARDGYKFSFHVRDRLENFPATMGYFFALHAARSKAKNMIVHPDRFTGYPQHSSLVAEFSAEMANREMLCIYQLEINAAVVATRIAFRFGGDVYLYYSGFDPAWRKYSVMTTLMVETMKWCIANRIKRVNLSTGYDLGKLRWRPVEIRYYNKLQVSPTLKGRLALCIYRLLRKQARISPMVGLYPSEA
jgi:CelD/BcsL family acetyltransferase involved in cellulose biosynthesis